MAINKNHEFEELDGIKCAIVEKNVFPHRVEFLKNLLEYNGYKVIVAFPPPKPPAQPLNTSTPSAPETFTVGVTDVTFNAVNAIFGRLLRTPDNHIVTLAYWQQKEKISHDELPYFENGN